MLKVKRISKVQTWHNKKPIKQLKNDEPQNDKLQNHKSQNDKLKNQQKYIQINKIQSWKQPINVKNNYK